jgi:recombinational DNA repair ATPase RecF
MRILSLELERYGPFTDRTLFFNPAAQLHVIYGRNATGKSCALAAAASLDGRARIVRLWSLCARATVEVAASGSRPPNACSALPNSTRVGSEP